MPASPSFCAARLVGAKAFHAVAVRLGSLADDGKRGRLPCSGNTVQADDLLLAGEDLFGCFLLGIVQLRMVAEQLVPAASRRSPARLQGKLPPAYG